MKFATLRTGEVVAQTKDGYRRVNRSSMIDLIENPSDLVFSGDPITLPDTLAPMVARSGAKTPIVNGCEYSPELGVSGAHIDNARAAAWAGVRRRPRSQAAAH